MILIFLSPFCFQSCQLMNVGLQPFLVKLLEYFIMPSLQHIRWHEHNVPEYTSLTYHLLLQVRVEVEWWIKRKKGKALVTSGHTCTHKKKLPEHLQSGINHKPLPRGQLAFLRHHVQDQLYLCDPMITPVVSKLNLTFNQLFLAIVILCKTIHNVINLVELWSAISSTLCHLDFINTLLHDACVGSSGFSRSYLASS